MRARILLGWYSRDAAVHALTTACVNEHGLTEDTAVAMWRPYHDRVQRLQDRPRTMPPEYELRAAEREHVRKFLRKARPISTSINRVVKVDPMLLAVHQLF